MVYKVNFRRTLGDAFSAEDDPFSLYHNLSFPGDTTITILSFKKIIILSKFNFKIKIEKWKF
jgi:hypothetical protein